MPNALIGSTGFVGGTLLKQSLFEKKYHSKNIENIDHNFFNIVVCAAAPAQKWIANSNPDFDFENIKKLISHLRTISCNKFILISTVDVFKNSVGANEDTLIDEDGLSFYGLHRRYLEKFIQRQFPNHLIVRLPGLVGPGLRKNIIFDLHNLNNIHLINGRSIFQFYPMVNLWRDIQIALNVGLKVIHLTAEPILVSDVMKKCFGKVFEPHSLNSPVVHYDMRSLHTNAFGVTGNYQYSARESIQAITAYMQSDLSTINQNILLKK